MSKLPFLEAYVDEALLNSFFADTDNANFDEALKDLWINDPCPLGKRTRQDRITALYDRLHKAEEMLVYTQTQIRELETVIAKRLDK